MKICPPLVKQILLFDKRLIGKLTAVASLPSLMSIKEMAACSSNRSNLARILLEDTFHLRVRR
jgi:hypothetical protein